ncbi:hypothetical protein [Dinghuibacter silviterrae]|uniref:Uncharacterized protein n=1 Tax=Dinghuibacter silviterrae TaxID=1539049 RepID=A0A4R8DFY8_9BACT|nr:hypothetical protein [Dinghuibacter silviterrae]TDW96268.1 hypothetical protein EDB95_4093 [Dinghuibacter silviterrae]
MKHIQALSFDTAKFVVLLLVCISLSPGCLPSPAGPSRAPRKKMFTLDETDGLWEGNSLTSPGSRLPNAMVAPSLPFAMSDTLLQGRAGMEPYVLLRMPSADVDFLLLGAKNYEAWFPGWLKSWSQTGRQGLVIDLSSGKATGRTTFQLSAPGLDSPVPLVLLWDDASGQRAGFYTQLLQSLTTIECKNL